MAAEIFSAYDSTTVRSGRHQVTIESDSKASPEGMKQLLAEGRQHPVFSAEEAELRPKPVPIPTVQKPVIRKLVEIIRNP